MRLLPLTIALAILASSAETVAAQNTAEPTTQRRRSSLAVESDVLSYGLNGYSAILSATSARGLQAAFGVGRYDVPAFLLEGDANYETAQWNATATSVQVLRTTYRFKGAMKNGLALGAVVLNQNFRLSGEKLTGETKFQQLSVGLTAGYYLHIGKHFYVYPTTAFTYNSVVSGTPTLDGTTYHVPKWAPNASLHMGWEWSR